MTPPVTASENLTVVRGSMDVISSGALVGAGGSAGAGSQVEQLHIVNLTGALQFMRAGDSQAAALSMGLAAAVEMKRRVAWQYSVVAGHFYTELQVNGTWQAVVATVGEAGSADTTAVSMVGTLQLLSPTWPGPGFTGVYTWAGNVTMSPDPWSLVTSSAVPAARRMRHLQSAPAVQAGVSGDVRVTEVTAVAVPSLLQDTLRGDDMHFLDGDGSVFITQATSLPVSVLSTVPNWKQMGVTVTPPKAGYAGYTGAALAGIAVGTAAAVVGVALLAVLGFKRLRYTRVDKPPGAVYGLQAADSAVTGGAADASGPVRSHAHMHPPHGA